MKSMLGAFAFAAAAIVACGLCAAAVPESGSANCGGKGSERPLKVLMIGNSFSESVMQETPRLAKSAGLKMDIVQCGIGGCPLNKHWANVEKAGDGEFKPYTVKESLVSWSGSGRKFPARANVTDMLAADKWDVVTIQQASGSSAFYDTYEPFAGKLVAKIRELAPQAEIVIQETWSYSPYDLRLATWKMSPKDMYESLRKAYSQLASKYGLRKIPTGDAVQMFRDRLPVDYGTPLTRDEIAALKNPAAIDFHGDVVGASAWKTGRKGSQEDWEEIKLRNDFSHLNGRGHYLQACVWLGFLFGVDPTTFTYSPECLTASEAKLMRECARDALQRGGAEAHSAAEAFTIDHDIPAGNVIVDSIEGDVAKVRQDFRDTKDGWFYWAFRVKGAAGKTVRFVFTDKYGGGPVGVRGPVVSKDGGKTFAYPLDGKSKNSEFTYTFGPDENETLFYECHPYVLANWEAFVARHSADIAAGKMKIETLCKSRKGADVPRVRYGCLSGTPKYRILVTCRHHASESLASWVVEGIADSFMADDDLGKWLRENVEMLCVPMMDYDGVQAGDQGKGRAPHDHNNDYTEFLYPETKALTEWVTDYAGRRLDAFLDIHCPWIRGQYNEFVYTPLKDPKLYPATEGFFSATVEKLQEGGLRYKASDDLGFGVAWNKGSKKGWSSSSWIVHNVKGLKTCRAFEFPFANANGAVVTPEKCRLFGHGIAKALRVLMTAQPANP